MAHICYHKPGQRDVFCSECWEAESVGARFIEMIIKDEASKLFPYHPYDARDIGSCLKLLQKYPEFDIKRMENYGYKWKLLAESWDELKELYEEGNYERINALLFLMDNQTKIAVAFCR